MPSSKIRSKGKGFLPQRRERRKIVVYARVTSIRFPPSMREEVARVGRGLALVLRDQRGFNGLRLLTEPGMSEGLIVSFWETQADVEASESSPSYVGQMSMMSSFLYGPLYSKTYEVNVQA